MDRRTLASVFIKYWDMIFMVLLLIVLVGIGLAAYYEESHMKDNKPVGRFTEPTTYKQELELFKSLSRKQQEQYLNMPLSQKLSEYSN